MQKQLAMLTVVGAMLAVTGLAIAEDTVPTIVDPAAEGVTAPYLIPASRVSPSYPPAALEARYDGLVMMRATVLSDGTVGPIEVLDSSRKKLGFEKAATKAVSKWRFEPAELDGEAVDSYAWVRLRFRPPGTNGVGGFVAADFPERAVTDATSGGTPSVPGATIAGLGLASKGSEPDGGNHTLISDEALQKFQTYKRPPCIKGCIYDRSELIPPPNYGLAVVGSGQE